MGKGNSHKKGTRNTKRSKNKIFKHFVIFVPFCGLSYAALREPRLQAMDLSWPSTVRLSIPYFEIEAVAGVKKCRTPTCQMSNVCCGLSNLSKRQMAD